MDKVLKVLGVLALVVVLTASSNHVITDSPKGPWEFHLDIVNGRAWQMNSVTGEVYRIKSDGKDKVYKLKAKEVEVRIN